MSSLALMRAKNLARSPGWEVSMPAMKSSVVLAAMADLVLCVHVFQVGVVVGVIVGVVVVAFALRE